MSKWKEKIFDDVWKYLIGIVGGSSITGYLVSYIGQIPKWIWLLVTLVFICILLVYIYFYYPVFVIRIKKRRTLSYWKALKKTLIDYHSNDPIPSQKIENLEKNYSKIRNNLSDVISYYHLSIQKYLNGKHKNRGTKSGDLVLGNFKQCFSSVSLSEWKNKCKRKIPDELECFDELAKEIVFLKVDNKDEV